MKYEMTIKEACNSGFWSCLTPTDWIQFGAVIISLISVFIALYAAIVGRQSAKASEKSSESAKHQLIEMIKQRTDSVRPELFFKDEKYVFRLDKGMNFGKFNNADNQLYLNLTNIGNGHAKKIQIEWDFDKLSSSIEFIKKNQEENQYILDYKEGSHINFSESNFTFLDTDLKASGSVFITDKEYNISLPFSYTRILSIIIHLFITKQLAPDVIPSLKFSISYNDILNNNTSKQFIITPKIANMNSSQQEGEFTYEAGVNIEINEVS
ncbi:hypothetical protein ACS2QN_03050 [Bacillus cereus group sp. Bce021]|uniref:Uncharacterized protein n=1 Tax=Bacillus toyonensis TaxID=155322 RepID=A0ABX6GBZ5_9BACI|nr:hypothetical protein GPA05_20985 [Bacillus toyonensis]